MIYRWIAMMSLAGLVLAGCGRNEQVAIAVDSPQRTLQNSTIAPTIPVRLDNNSVVDLTDIASPIYAAVFVQADSPTPRVHPQVAELAGPWSLDYVTTVQVTLPPADGFAGNLFKTLKPVDEVIILLDPQRLAWDSFDRPAAGTILLVDRDGYIKAEATLEQPGEVSRQADRIRRRQDRQWQDWFGDVD